MAVTWMMRSALALLGVLSYHSHLAASTKVNVGLEAAFSSPPYLLELLETAAQENASSYFPLLDRIADGHFIDYTTEKELYEEFLKVLSQDGHLRDEEAISLFQLALSLHVAAPRIEAQYQYYSTSVEPLLMIAQDAACPVWVHFSGKQYCSPTLERAQQDFSGPADNSDLPFDRTLSLHHDLPLSTLYVDINSPLFGHFHQTLSETAKSGSTSYRIRYRPSTTEIRKPLPVGGYGIELSLKRTDYIVIDDRDAKKSEAEAVGASRGTELEDVADLKPLSSSELLGLGLKTSSYILGSKDPLETLLKVSQDFPKYSASISKLNASEEFVAEHQANREEFLPAGLNVIWMNGLQVAARQMDAFALLDRLRTERGLVSGFQDAGLKASEAISLISHSAITQAKASGEAQRYDWRDEIEGGNIIIWLNDIEKDTRYSDWPSHAGALLQRMYPGQLPTVKRDIHNLIIPLDLSTMADVEVAAETLLTFVQRGIPARFGVAPTANSQHAIDQAKIVYFLHETYGISSVIAYLQAIVQTQKIGKVDESLVDAVVKDRETRGERPQLSVKEVLDAEIYMERVQALQAYLGRLGATGPTPPVFVNGVVQARKEQWLQLLSNRLGIDLQMLQQKVHSEVIGDDHWMAGEFLKSAATHRNPLIIPEDEADVKLLNIGKIVSDHHLLYNELPVLPADSEDVTAWGHLVVTADFDSDAGIGLVREALTFKAAQPGVELLLVHNARPTTALNFKSARLFTLLVEKQDIEVEDLRWIEHDALSATGDEPDSTNEMAKTFWERMDPFISAIGSASGTNGVVLNGRAVGPIPQDAVFSAGDFEQLLKYERVKRYSPILQAANNLNLTDRLMNPMAAASVASLVALSSISDVPEGVYESSSSVRMDSFKAWKDAHSVITQGDEAKSSVQIIASIDPSSEIAQRWIPMLKVLGELSGVFVKIFLNPKERMQELPVKRFYRYVLNSKPVFTEDGSTIRSSAEFDGLPREALLNLGLDVPPAWLVSPKDSVYDLDNIKLSAVKGDGDINAVYELENILIEGHSNEVTTGRPPRGAQLLLGTDKDHHYADTLVMANLGYFQFKANPGYWDIRLKPGRSEEIFNIDQINAQGNVKSNATSSSAVALMSFQGKTLFPRLSRKVGKDMEDVLEDGIKPGSPMDFFGKAKLFGQGILGNVGLTPKVVEHADINIFSVASGHLYERMLNIMMVSVMKHTSHTVKFWFIEQFLSPSFKSTVPHLAAAYGFEYEMVTYKWPHWLRSQKEKQREIWGYKILFLDVLFPLSLDKVIFVDADQIVRTDMYELVTHDLDGAPYGFTPMCDSRTEMEGFRFWKQGYWANFLKGLPYHISALYVVDLKRFRQLAAGDRLRQQYHQLSADPGSLSNLDQDLPNNMQMQLPIHSLPQEWLWCETWCSDESLKDARTIDLCNNPLTKEPKLDRARRQVPEWNVYDSEIAEVFRKAKEAEGDAVQTAEGSRIQEELDLNQNKPKGKDEL